MTTATTTTAVPFRFFDLRVARTRRLGPGMVRVTFGGEQLAHFTSGGRDQRFKLFLPHPGQDAPLVPTHEDWFAQWRAMDPAVRGVMRSYTVREQRREQQEFDVDFAVHGGTGPASRWAQRAVPGDRVTALGPVVEDNGGVDFRPPPGTDWVLVTGDETALPAIAGILDWLPPGTRAKVWIEVGHAADRQELPTAADADIVWLVRDAADDPLLAAVRSAELPDGTPYAWIAGEAGAVRALRRHLVGMRGFDRRAVKFTGYWRRGATEEDLLAEAVSGTAAAED
ncbi:siderophore-interacting protein [Streptantibioticus rubrisoli]|uniref:Siderophore-interacting protein n=1 Tax=Streptantibioticus rubrisoli TaxID=1387313 RepID=A0ABT1P5V9_9ACTN|nr:siderophore-interacting protein [Streptantibioticus rubrisoli]MCQ4040759.1 siderophore-interacting protein [Streptantibioticus rubrisoli]